MIFERPLPERGLLRSAIDAHHRADETACVQELLRKLDMSDEARARIGKTASRLVRAVRTARRGGAGSMRSCTNTAFRHRKACY